MRGGWRICALLRRIWLVLRFVRKGGTEKDGVRELMRSGEVGAGDELFIFPRASSMSFFLAAAVRDICSSAEAIVMYSSSGSMICTDSLIALLSCL